MKKKGNVEYKKFPSTNFSTSIYRNKSLFDEDMIRTGSDGFTKVVYLDDGTAVKLHKNSQVYIQGNIESKEIIKQMTVITGIMKLDVNNKFRNELKIVTPTSVATIKGTRFWMDVNNDKGDKFYGLQGVVEITNNFSGNSLQLSPNNMVISLPDGEMNIQPINLLSLQQLETLEINMGEPSEDMPEIPPNGSLMDSLLNQNNSSDINQLRIKLNNSSGDEKHLIIKYTD